MTEEQTAGPYSMIGLQMRRRLYCFFFAALAAYGVFLFLWHPTPSSIHADPESAYIINSVMVANGRAPTHADHPGSTTQIIGALVARTFGYTPDNILAHYDKFRITSGILVFAACATLWLLLVRFVEDLKLSCVILLAAWCLCFVGREGMFALTAFSSETGLLLTGLGILVLFARQGRNEPEFSWPVYIGISVLCGLTLASKISALPFCVGLALVASTLGRHTGRILIFRAAVFGLVAAGTFGVTVYGLGAMPRFLYFLHRLVNRRGLQGQGPKRDGLADYLPTIEGAGSLWLEDPWLTLLVIAAAVLAGSLCVERWRRDKRGVLRAFGWLVAIVGSFLPLLEHPRWRYYLPGEIAIAGMLVLEASRAPLRFVRIGFTPVAALAVACVALFAAGLPVSKLEHEQQFDQHNAILNHTIFSCQPDLVIVGFRVNAFLGFTQLLTAYYYQPPHEVSSLPPLDPRRYFGFELGSYLPWADAVKVAGQTLDPTERRALIITSEPFTGTLVSRFRLVSRASSGRLYIYSTNSALLCYVNRSGYSFPHAADANCFNTPSVSPAAAYPAWPCVLTDVM